MMFKYTKEDRTFLEECLWIPCSLDSGAFTTTIPQKLLRKLRDPEVSWEENNLDKPMQIDQAVAGRTYIAESLLILLCVFIPQCFPYYFMDFMF